MTQVLVVDDDESVRLLMALILDALGWTVRTAASGSDALRAAHAGTVDVLVTDVTLGDISGLAVAAEVRRLYPDAGLLLISGHSAETVGLLVTDNGVRAPGHAARTSWLAKPFGVAELKAAALSVSPGTRG